MAAEPRGSAGGDGAGPARRPWNDLEHHSREQMLCKWAARSHASGLIPFSINWLCPLVPPSLIGWIGDDDHPAFHFFAANRKRAPCLTRRQAHSEQSPRKRQDVLNHEPRPSLYVPAAKPV
ncbi:unnamed protein product [Pipistrellus nathusii]|uniref:Uncharacterized protein n=1 Tax=Pipistrellus nathusii TaxID=59473 RepID=A0ABP0AIT5_PIPNA